jgi:hypothetical protein
MVIRRQVAALALVAGTLALGALISGPVLNAGAQTGAAEKSPAKPTTSGTLKSGLVTVTSANYDQNNPTVLTTGDVWTDFYASVTSATATAIDCTFTVNGNELLVAADSRSPVVQASLVTGVRLTGPLAVKCPSASFGATAKVFVSGYTP